MFTIFCSINEESEYWQDRLEKENPQDYHTWTESWEGYFFGFYCWNLEKQALTFDFAPNDDIEMAYKFQSATEAENFIKNLDSVHLQRWLFRIDSD